MKLSVHQYRIWKTEQKKKALGFLDDKALAEVEELVKRYAVQRQQYKQAKAHRINGDDFNPFTDDPNCKSCRKVKRNFYSNQKP